MEGIELAPIENDPIAGQIPANQIPIAGLAGEIPITGQIPANQIPITGLAGEIPITGQIPANQIPITGLAGQLPITGRISIAGEKGGNESPSKLVIHQTQSIKPTLKNSIDRRGQKI